MCELFCLFGRSDLYGLSVREDLCNPAAIVHRFLRLDGSSKCEPSRWLGLLPLLRGLDEAGQVSGEPRQDREGWWERVRKARGASSLVYLQLSICGRYVTTAAIRFLCGLQRQSSKPGFESISNHRSSHQASKGTESPSHVRTVDGMRSGQVFTPVLTPLECSTAFPADYNVHLLCVIMYMLRICSCLELRKSGASIVSKGG